MKVLISDDFFFCDRWDDIYEYFDINWEIYRDEYDVDITTMSLLGLYRTKWNWL